MVKSAEAMKVYNWLI